MRTNVHLQAGELVAVDDRHLRAGARSDGGDASSEQTTRRPPATAATSGASRRTIGCPPTSFSSRSCARAKVGAIISAASTCLRASSRSPACEQRLRRGRRARRPGRAARRPARRGTARTASAVSPRRQRQRPERGVRRRVERIDGDHALQRGPAAAPAPCAGSSSDTSWRADVDVGVVVRRSACSSARAARALSPFFSATPQSARAGCLRRARSAPAAPPARTPQSPRPDSAPRSASPSAICAGEALRVARPRSPSACRAACSGAKPSGTFSARRSARVALVEERVEASSAARRCRRRAPS